MSVQHIPALNLVCTRGWGTPPRPGAISKTKAVRPSRTPWARREHRHWTASLGALSCASSMPGWRGETRTIYPHIQCPQAPRPPPPPGLRCGLSQSSGSRGSRSMVKTADDSHLQGAAPAASSRWSEASFLLAGCREGQWQAGRDGTRNSAFSWHRSNLPTEGWAWTDRIPVKLLLKCLATLYRNPGPVLLLVFYLSKPHPPPATKPRDNAESRMHLISTNANRGNSEHCLPSTSSGSRRAAGAVAGEASCCGKWAESKRLSLHLFPSLGSTLHNPQKGRKQNKTKLLCISLFWPYILPTAMALRPSQQPNEVLL